MKGLIWLPNNDEITLAKYRIEKAKDCLKASKLLLDDGLYADSANRSYYAIFHSMNALCALRSVGYKKHSGVLSDFNQNYVKTNLIEIEYSKIAKTAFSVRTKSDYSDFYVVSKQDVVEQYKNAVKFIDRIDRFINESFTKEISYQIND